MTDATENDLAEIIERFSSAGEYESSIAWVRGACLVDAKAHFGNRTEFAQFYREELHVDRSYVSRCMLIAENTKEPEARSLRWVSRCEAVAKILRDSLGLPIVTASGERLTRENVIDLANTLESVSALKTTIYGEKPEKPVKRLRCPDCNNVHAKDEFEEVVD